MKNKLSTVLLNSGKVKSLGEARMLIAEHAVKVNSKTVIQDIDIEMCDEIFSAGRFRFLVSKIDLS